MTLTQTITDSVNFIKDIKKDYSVIPSEYDTLIDLGTDHYYNHISLVNDTNSDILIKFYNNTTPAEYTIPAGTSLIFDRFLHNNIVEYKYVSAPGAGYFKLTSWLGLQ